MIPKILSPLLLSICFNSGKKLQLRISLRACFGLLPKRIGSLSSLKALSRFKNYSKLICLIRLVFVWSTELIRILILFSLIVIQLSLTILKKQLCVRNWSPLRLKSP